jgi:hypothetical protein
LTALALLGDGAAAPPVVAAAALAIGSAVAAIPTRMASRTVTVLDLSGMFFDAYGVS